MAENKMPERMEKVIRVVWGSGEGIKPYYVNHIFVSHAGGTEFHIIFGHLAPPLTMGLEEKEFPEQLEIQPVASIVTSPEVMKAFVRVLVDNLEKFEEAEQKKEQADADDTSR